MPKGTTATQPGADDKSTEDLATPSLNARNASMEEIANRVEAHMYEELGIEKPAEEPDPEVKAEEDAGNIATPEVKEEPKPEINLVKVKVDGEEREVPFDEVLSSYQIRSAASKRLEEAALARRENEDRERQIAERERQIAEREARIAEQINAVQAKPEEAKPEDETITRFLNAIYEGDTNAATEAFGKLNFAGRSPATPEQSIDLNEIATKAAEQAEARINAKAAQDMFVKEYKDIVENPQLAKVADTFFEEEAKDKPFAEALMEAGRRTREWVESIAPKTQDKPADRKETREKKATIDQPTSQSAIASAANEEVEETPSDIITKMRAQRGLPA